jgi:membrane protein
VSRCVFPPAEIECKLRRGVFCARMEAVSFRPGGPAYEPWERPTLAPVALVREMIRRFVGIQGVDRGVAIGAHAFTAVIPLVMLYSAIVPRNEGTSTADAVIARLHLAGPSADAAREAFTPTIDTASSSVSFIGFVLLIIAALSFTRAVQRLYENAFRLPALGMRGTPYGLLWVALLALPTVINPIIRNHAEGWVKITLSLILACAVWIITPRVLSSRRLSWRQVLPSGVITAIAMTVLSIASAIWLPHSVAVSAQQYGVIGVAFAIVSWLVGAGMTVAGSVVTGAVLSEAFAARSNRA